MSAAVFEIPNFNKPDTVIETSGGELLLLPDCTAPAPAPPVPTPSVPAVNISVGNDAEAAEEAAAEAEASKEDLLPVFPRFTGALSELADALCPDIPYEFKVMAGVTFWGLIRSGYETFANEPHIQPRFYTCFIADPWRGKSAAINEVRNAMAQVSANFSAVSSIDSGPALIDAFEEQTEKTMVANSTGSRLLLDPDELKDLFEKSKTTTQGRNSLFTEFLKLFEGNRTGNRSRSNGNTQLEHAHLGILGCATTEGYPTMWTGTGGGSSGLQSRFTLIGTNSSKMPAQQRPPNKDAVAAAIARLKKKTNRIAHFIRMTPEAAGMLDEWWSSTLRDKPSEARIPDLVKRLLLVLASTNGTDTVDQKLMEQGIAFGEYEIAAREKYNPADSYSWTQAFENQIVQVFRKHGMPKTQNVVRRYVRPDRKPGGFGPFIQAWKNLVMVGVLKPCGNTERSTKYQL